ncbi:hypothetical protein D1007_41699 [Hordeum vulgare]|nr:hypothetical protein D1007_41699 [Hordeum vulgare]
MLGHVVHNETTAAEQGGFINILANFTCRAFAMEEPLEYIVYQERTSDATRHFWATIHIYGRSITPECPYRFAGRSTSYEPQAIQLAAREAIVQLRHVSPRVNYRSFYYYRSREGYGRPPQVASGSHETDPALLHLVRFMRAQKALYEQVTLDLIAARGELARLDLRRREVEPHTTNPVGLFGRPIEPLRSNPAAGPNHVPISPEELRRTLGISFNGMVATTPCNGHHGYPSLVVPPSPQGNPDAIVPRASTSMRPAHLDVNEVD